ncbi:MAG: hypothetical protein IKN36_02930 [Clostridia bacterium]|nr:hypothetical protein [Clostridia bacterium]
MKIHSNCRRLTSFLLAVLIASSLIVPMTLPVSAANRRFITELRVAAGEDAVATLEADGWSVMMVGLNVTSDPAAQVYLAFKQNTGAPITNVIVSPDVGDTCTDSKGFIYNCVSHVDVDTGIEGSAGCIYATTDERAGAPLVGLDVLRGDSATSDVLYPITNDGAEIVRTPSGAPADLENTGTTGVVYLAQIRDGIVRPYISEIGVVTDTDKWNAVYTACERGYNYYVEGDIDDSTETYTIIAYERTANPKKAITNITAVSEETVRSLEEEHVVDPSSKSEDGATAASITISRARYVRVSSTPVSAEEPYYLYMTKNRAAGNPISMIYVGSSEQTENLFFGMWANSYFFSPGKTTAYMYGMNEDLYASLWNDQTVCAKIPVQYLDGITRSTVIEPVQQDTSEDPVVTSEPVNDISIDTDQPAETQPVVDDLPSETQAEAEEQSSEDQTEAEEQPSETQEETEELSPETQEETEELPPETQEVTEELPPETQEEPEETTSEAEEVKTEPAKPEANAGDETVRYINLTMLTPRDGLPTSAGRITGMGDPNNITFIERTQRSDRVNKFQASVFSGKTGIALIAGGAVIIAAAAFVIFKKRSGKKAPAAPQKSKKR